MSLHRTGKYSQLKGAQGSSLCARGVRRQQRRKVLRRPGDSSPAGPPAEKHHFGDTKFILGPNESLKEKQSKRGVPGRYAVLTTATAFPWCSRWEHLQHLLLHPRTCPHLHPQDQALRHTPGPRRNCSPSLQHSRKQFSLGLTKYLLK